MFYTEKPISIRIHESVLKEIETYVDGDTYSSINQFIRSAINMKLRIERDIIEVRKQALESARKKMVETHTALLLDKGRIDLTIGRNREVL